MCLILLAKLFGEIEDTATESKRSAHAYEHRHHKMNASSITAGGTYAHGTSRFELTDRDYLMKSKNMQPWELSKQ